VSEYENERTTTIALINSLLTLKPATINQHTK